MQAFLDKCVEYLFDNYRRDLSDLCIVLPNRRAGLFMKKHTAKRIEKPQFMPEILSIEDFITEVSGFGIIDNISLLFELYEVHKSCEKNNAQSFEKFSDWAFSLLKDFNDADEYLADAKALFSYLTDAKAIELWNPKQNTLTTFEKQYLSFYNSLFDYYELLRKRLTSAKLVYQGIASRHVAENIKDLEAGLPWKMIFFIGFSAMTKAGEKIISELVISKKAEILWDADNYYLEHAQDGVLQEAGEFLRKHFSKRHFESPKWVSDDFKNHRKKINISGTPQNIGQVKLCGEILSGFSKENINYDETAVVLANESLLLPLLNSIPREIKEFNITMGYPLKLTPANQLFENIFQLNKNTTKFAERKNEEKGLLYIRDILQILRHPLISGFSNELTGQSVDTYNTGLKKLIDLKKVFYTKEELYDLISTGKKNNIFSLLFKSWHDDPVRAVDQLRGVIEVIRTAIISKNKDKRGYQDQLDIEYLFQFSLILKRIKSLINQYASIDNCQTLHTIFQQIVKVSSIPFYGEPLRGLQIMGVLETRTLDFKNLIILSVNEDVLPASKSQVSFIPLDIKKQFNLPTFKERDAVYAYHFYRLLQRSEEVHLIYNTEPGKLGGSDKSRFINQIRYELPKYNPGIIIREKVYTSGLLKTKPEKGIIIEKNSEILELIYKKTRSGFSATSLNRLRKCPFQFYLSDLIGISEEEDLEESIDAATLGTVIHDSLKDIYAPFLNDVLKKEALSQALHNIKSIVTKNFHKSYQSGDLNYGKNHLILQVARDLISKEVKNELNKLHNSEVNILGLEQYYESYFTLVHNAEKREIKLKGTIDRIDKVDGITRIIDYKTGTVDARDLVVKNPDDLQSHLKMDKCFQLLFYSQLYFLNRKTQDFAVEPGIISLRKKKNQFMPLKYNNNNFLNEQSMKDFHSILENIFLDLLDPAMPILQAEDLEVCKYCEFKNICNR